ncbi:SDR family oxidoreductase [Grimontia kaedaensis]|uniref:SDR family oxidoreductase n=1 Tax=Grimontia kaedaensis TaxID=2872157 RepID=A0ABY4X164_9GAMM|nr:SDR family oxidoreductase [Grimontia kaedaensis]USH04973.1 SDR family oxidoreductase [Grimontia kaedaensis]
MAMASKHMLITGANRGIGLALTQIYLDAGWHVHACCRHPSEATDLNALATQYESLSIHALDVTDHADIDALAQSLSGKQFNLILNNAGYYGPKGCGFGNTDMDEWRKVLEINTLAPLKIAEAFYPHLLAAKGTFAAVSSKVGSMAENTSGGGYIYRSSKAALNSVVKSLSNDLSSQGIISVALHPGWVQTEMGGPNALISAEESAQGLYVVLEGLEAKDSGGFLNYQGEKIPW